MYLHPPRVTARTNTILENIGGADIKPRLPRLRLLQGAVEWIVFKESGSISGKAKMETARTNDA